MNVHHDGRNRLRIPTAGVVINGTETPGRVDTEYTKRTVLLFTHKNHSDLDIVGRAPYLLNDVAEITHRHCQ